MTRTAAKEKPPTTGAAELKTLNFKVPTEFKKAYKIYAAQQGISMLELLREGFELSKRRRSQ